MSKLRIADNLKLPLEAATQTLLIVGKRGSGKSSTATRFAEQLIDAHIPVAVLDPVDVWWGLKAGADGQREGGKEVYIFGGKHADMPLEPTAGALMADVLVGNRINAVMVLREFSNRDKARFGAAFAERLYRQNQEVLQLIVEEAHELMPQQPFKGEEEMLGWMLRLQKLGRTSGVGMSSVTQRPASLNKNATTQAEILVAHRLIGPQDVKAIEEWIKHHRQEALKQQVLSTLPELKTGEAWVWAPDFPEEHPIGLKRVHILMPETFDSRRTPKPGERRVEPKQLAQVDLEKLGAQMAATRERVKQTDPKFLQMEVAKLRAELARKPQVLKPATIQKIETQVIKDAQVLRLERAAARLETVAESITKAFTDAANKVAGTSSEVVAEIRQLVTAVRQHVKTQTNGAVAAARVDPRPALRPALAPRPVLRPAPREPVQEGEDELSKQAREMLEELARRHPSTLTEGQLATLSGYSRKSSQWGPNLRALVNAGHVVKHGGVLEVTETGLAVAGVASEGLPSLPDQVVGMWLSKLPVQAAAFLRVVWDAYPHHLTLEELAEKAGYSMASSQFRPALKMLERNGLVEDEGGVVTMSRAIFEVAGRV